MPTLLGIFIIIILFVIWKFIREMIKENRDKHSLLSKEITP